MTTLKTEYKGYEIQYREDSNTWFCYVLDTNCNSLATIKTKIDAIDIESRRVDNVKAIQMDYSGRPRLVTITLVDDNSAWTLFADPDRKGKLKREKVRLNTLILATPENEKRLTDLYAEVERTRKAADAVRAEIKAMPTLTAEALVALKGDLPNAVQS